MVKLNLDIQDYYYDDDSYDDDGSYYEGGDDFDLLKNAFEKLCEQNIVPGRINYYHYMAVKNKQRQYREAMLTGVRKNGFSR